MRPVATTTRLAGASACAWASRKSRGCTDGRPRSTPRGGRVPFPALSTIRSRTAFGRRGPGVVGASLEKWRDAPVSSAPDFATPAGEWRRLIWALSRRCADAARGLPQPAQPSYIRGRMARRDHQWSGERDRLPATARRGWNSATPRVLGEQVGGTPGRCWPSRPPSWALGAVPRPFGAEPGRSQRRRNGSKVASRVELA